MQYRDLAYSSADTWRERDPQENALGRLPADEGVQVPAIWVVEVYTPSTVSGVLKGIANLGWEHGKTRDESLTKWMSDVREGRLAGWTSLGLVSSVNAAHFMSERTAALPVGVSAAYPTLLSLTPSLTALVVSFLLDDGVAASLEDPLRAEFTTFTRGDPYLRPWHVVRHILFGGPARLGRRIHTPDFIRREAVNNRLREIENDCVMWVRGHFPGAFVSLPGSRTPTAALLVTERVRPMSSEARKVRALDGLALDRDYDAWESSEWPGARLVLPRGWDAEGGRLVFACRRHDAFPDEAGYHSPNSNWTIAQRAGDHVRGLLSRWAITCLLDGYHEALATLRDRTARDGRYRTVSDLKEFRSLARTTLFDIGACTQEICEFADAEMMYVHDVMEMAYVREVRGVKAELLKTLRSSQVKRARQVQREATLLQSTLSITNDLTQTISSVTVQRWAVVLSLLSTVVAMVALWIVFTGSSQ